ncbi:MAG: LOG family protein [Propionibacteriales bacterium]|nr:LOG family protein [Propionibacteriales bacterium]
MSAAFGQTEIESVDQLQERLRHGDSLRGCWVQSVDLSAMAAVLQATDVRGAMFLGCTFAPGSEAEIEARGALVFPGLPDLPFNPYRTGLYSPAELYADLDAGYRYTRDAVIYRWWRHVGQHRSLTSELAMTLHDHAITEALGDCALAGAIGVMGGHRVTRDSADYAAAADLGRALAQAGHAVITGGGPGAMEAVNLGAGLAGTAADLRAAVDLVSAAPTFTAAVEPWAQTAFTVTERFELQGASYGVPTWLYGHEPPNAFCVGVAKLFSNAIREDVLLRLASGGLVCLPGAAGTVQEIFQAVTPRYYAGADESIAPLILVGVDYWTTAMPAWPLLSALADGRAMSARLHLVDSVAEVAGLLSD